MLTAALIAASEGRKQAQINQAQGEVAGLIGTAMALMRGGSAGGAAAAQSSSAASRPGNSTSV